MRKLLSATMLVACGLLVGCGDDTGETKETSPNGEVNPQSARSSTTTAIAGARLALGGEGISAANQLSALGTSALGMVGPSGSQPQGYGQVKQPAQTGVCDCDATSCTFQDCGDDASPNAFTINGSISWAGGNVVADLRYKGGDIAGSTYDFGVKMNVTATETSIDGTVSTDGAVTAQGQNVTWDSSLLMNDIQFNASGCPQSGSLEVDATVSYGASQSYTGKDTITFDGAGC